MERGDRVIITRGVWAGRPGTVERIIPAGYGVKCERVEIRVDGTGQDARGGLVGLAVSSVELITEERA